MRIIGCVGGGTPGGCTVDNVEGPRAEPRRPTGGSAPSTAGGQTGPRWYVAQTQADREQVAQLHLRRQRFVTFLPMVLQTVRHARKVQQARKAYFPGYLFVRIDVGAQAWRSINGTIGVSRLLTTGDRPQPTPVGLVEMLLGAADPAGIVNLTPALAIGQQVRIVSGPFADRLGIVERLGGPERVRILLELMTMTVPVEVTRGQIAPTGHMTG